MNEFRAALLGAIIGALASIGGVAMQGQITRSKDIQTEQRQKLEALMEEAFKVNECLDLQLRRTEGDANCQTFTSEFKLVTLASLYFPELENEVADYTILVAGIRQKIAQCPNREYTLPHLKCLQEIMKAPLGGNELQALADKAGRIARKLH